MKTPRPVILCVLDGWGERAARENNAVALAHTPVLDRLAMNGPRARLEASEEHVGLPAGQMGNSEVGHMNLGAGRTVMQDLPRIDAAVAKGEIAAMPVLKNLVAKVRAAGGVVHLMGLMSPGGVHSHQDQIAHLANILLDAGVEVVVHALLDGRDTPPSSALGYLAAFAKAAPGARIGAVIGRYFAMDRDSRWERVSEAYAAIAGGQGAAADDARRAIEQSYDHGETDEFVKPAVIGGYAGMADGDGLLVANFRADRIREILAALLDPEFAGFERQTAVRFSGAVGMTSYSVELDGFLDTLFPAQPIDNVLGSVVAAANLRQLRIAETEKYAHVTFFFNGGEESPFTGEDRVLIPSPKVATYDLQPEMSAAEVTDRLIAEIEGGRYDFIVVNYANTDMVGHTGIVAAAIRAVETVDTCIGRLEAAVRQAGGAMLITADHGNAEQMTDASTGQPHTAHTMNPVPLIFVSDAVRVGGLEDGRLADMAPTVLDLLGIAQPVEMTGKSLIIRAGEARAAE